MPMVHINTYRHLQVATGESGTQVTERREQGKEGTARRHTRTDNMVPPLHMCELGTADSDLGECRKASICALGEGGSGGGIRGGSEKGSEGDQSEDRDRWWRWELCWFESLAWLV